MSENSQEHPNPEYWWKIRRRTMYVAIVLICIFTFAFVIVGLQKPPALESMGVLIGWVYGVLSLPVVGYYGNTAVEEYAKNRKK